MAIGGSGLEMIFKTVKAFGGSIVGPDAENELGEGRWVNVDMPCHYAQHRNMLILDDTVIAEFALLEWLPYPTYQSRKHSIEANAKRLGIEIEWKDGEKLRFLIVKTTDIEVLMSVFGASPFTVHEGRTRGLHTVY